MPNHYRCEGNIAIKWPPAFILEHLHRHACSRREISREIRVTNAPVAKVHPTISWRGLTPYRSPIAIIVKLCYISEARRAYASVLNLKYAVLSGKTATGTQFPPVHRLNEKAPLMSHT